MVHISEIISAVVIISERTTKMYLKKTEPNAKTKVRARRTPCSLVVHTIV